MLEALIATGIIVTAVSSALTLVSASVGAEKDSEGRIIGGGLAREGIEVVRAIRDSNWLADAQWDLGLEGTSNDYSGVPVFSPATNSWAVLFPPTVMTDPETVVHRYTTTSTPQEAIGLFVQAASPPTNTSPTIFRRLMFLYPICSNDLNTPITSGVCTPNTKIGIQVLSQVQWKTGGQTRSVQMEERLFNWR